LRQKTCLAAVSVLVELELEALVVLPVAVLVAVPVAALELALEAQLVDVPEAQLEEVLEASQEVMLEHDPRREASSRCAKNDQKIAKIRRKARSCPFHRCLFLQ